GNSSNKQSFVFYLCVFISALGIEFAITLIPAWWCFRIAQRKWHEEAAKEVGGTVLDIKIMLLKAEEKEKAAKKEAKEAKKKAKEAEKNAKEA
ncbi:hypothetical protein PRIPAC_88523, partial [Pristionchus pacificus]